MGVKGLRDKSLFIPGGGGGKETEAFGGGSQKGMDRGSVVANRV